MEDLRSQHCLAIDSQSALMGGKPSEEPRWLMLPILLMCTLGGQSLAYDGIGIISSSARDEDIGRATMRTLFYYL